MEYTTRRAILEDIPSITTIYNEGIEDKIATLETRLRTKDEMRSWLIDRSDKHKIVVGEDKKGVILGWASLNQFNSRCCYSGVADISIYVRRGMRGKGVGKGLLNFLTEVGKEKGFHKLVLSMIDSNISGKKLYLSSGFREVGTYINQGIIDGKWVNITIMEKLLVDAEE